MQGLIFLVETHRRWAMKFVLLLLAFVSFVIAQNTPEPFGLKLRVSTKEETLQVMKKRGWKGYEEWQPDNKGRYSDFLSSLK